MVIAGIDVGVITTKVVIMKDDTIVGRGTAPTGGMDRPENIRKAYDAALEAAGMTETDVEKVIATGKGKFDCAFADDYFTDTIAAGRAAKFLCPEVTGVMDCGADETLAAKLGEKRLIDEFVVNQKCAAGIGTYLQYLAARLGISPEEFSECSGPDVGKISDGCVVFSELDALSLLKNGADPKCVCATAIRAAAVRAATVLVDLTACPGDRVALFGGLTKNKAFVSALETTLNRKFIIPEEAYFSGAIGAVMCGKFGI